MPPGYRPPQVWFNEVALIALGAVVRDGPTRMGGYPIDLRYWDGTFLWDFPTPEKRPIEAVQTQGIAVPDDVIIAFNECGVVRS
jgi:hypothetical protein